MSKTVGVPIYEETEIEKLIPKIKELWEVCKKLKKTYPSVWSALSNQYNLEIFSKKISDWLFEKKLEVLLLQDDELRKQ